MCCLTVGEERKVLSPTLTARSLHILYVYETLFRALDSLSPYHSRLLSVSISRLWLPPAVPFDILRAASGRLLTPLVCFKGYGEVAELTRRQYTDLSDLDESFPNYS